MSVQKLAMVSILALSIGGANATAASQPNFLPHRAVYDISLLDADERSGIDAMSGKMVYEFTGSPCQGYQTDFRFVTTVEGNGSSQLSDQRTKSFEDPDGKTFVFSTQTFTDEKRDKDLEGVAEQIDGSVVVTIDKPDQKDVMLGKAIFPVTHMVEVINRALRGDAIYEARIFDASDDADEIMLATTMIGKSAAATESSSEHAVLDKGAGKKSWPITTSYYKATAKTDSLPEYQMTMTLHDNGVTHGLTMRYSGFALKGTMTAFEALPAEKCD